MVANRAVTGWHHWRPLAWVWAVGLVVALATRALLAVFAGVEAGLDLPSLVRIFAVGALYDAAWLAYISLPIVLALWLVPAALWQRRTGRVLRAVARLVLLFLFLFVAVAEWIFWEEFNARFNFIAVDYLVYTREVLDNLLESYPMGWLLGSITASAVVLDLALRAVWRRRSGPAPHLRARTGMALALLTSTLVLALALDQGPRRAYANVLQGELASNGPYQFFAAFRNNELDYGQFYLKLDEADADAELRRQLLEPHARFVSTRPFDIERVVENPGPERRLNVVLVTVESLSAAYLGRFGNTRELTPNLDALVGQGLFFSRFYATGTRTVRGLEAVTLSIPPTPGRAIVKRIGRESGMWSLGNVLRAKGYATRFLYGGRGYFDNMNAFFAGNGYDITDQSSVPDAEIGFSNAWGMSDEDLYRQVVTEADRAARGGQPFFFHVMTTSNHRPYTYPEGKVAIPSGSGRNGAVQYTDHALGAFLAEARRHAWFDDTLFVILADHTASAAGREELPLARYHIPMWIYAPRHVHPREVDTLASQVDVAPTLLALLGMTYRSAAFGRDLLAPGAAEGRVPLANYEHLGLLHPGLLAVLSPGRKAVLERLDGETVLERGAGGIVDAAVRADVALYQGASEVYRRQLNAWRPGSAVAAAVAPAGT